MQYKKGCGTALYVKAEFDHSYIHELSFSDENCFEVVTVEIKVKQGQGTIVECLYRPPNVSMKLFMDT